MNLFRTAIVSAVMFLASSQIQANGTFCDGFKEGYAEGWCYKQSGCIKPIAPICPIPAIGERGYQDGYNRGFAEGIAAKQGR